MTKLELWQISIYEKKTNLKGSFSKNILTTWQQIRCSLGSVLRFSQCLMVDWLYQKTTTSSIFSLICDLNFTRFNIYFAHPQWLLYLNQQCTYLTTVNTLSEFTVLLKTTIKTTDPLSCPFISSARRKSFLMYLCIVLQIIVEQWRLLHLSSNTQCYQDSPVYLIINRCWFKLIKARTFIF